MNTSVKCKSINALARRAIAATHATIMVAVFFSWTPSVLAQVFKGPVKPLTSFLYTTTFVCGSAEPTRDVQSTEDAVLSPYDDLEPGSYSAFVNVQNTSYKRRNINFYVSVQGLPNNLFIETVPLGALESRRFGCLNFMDNVRDNWPGGVLFGQAIQGSIYFIQLDDAVDLVTTQTYSTKRRDGDNGGGVSVDVTREKPRKGDGARILRVPLP